jgi:hypothetical protein
MTTSTQLTACGSATASLVVPADADLDDEIAILLDNVRRYGCWTWKTGGSLARVDPASITEPVITTEHPSLDLPALGLVRIVVRANFL